MFDLFEITVSNYGYGSETMMVWGSNEADACETARFHYNSDLRNRIDSCKQIASGWEAERHHAFLD